VNGLPRLVAKLWSYRGNLCRPGKVTGYWVTTPEPLYIRNVLGRSVIRVLANVKERLVTGNLVTIAGRTVTNRLPRGGPGHIETTLDQRKYDCDAHGNRTWCVAGYFVHAPRALLVGLAWKVLGSHMFCNMAESCYGAYEARHTPGRGTIGGMAARDPFQLDRDQSERDTEYGFGAGKFPDPRFDYSGGGSISGITIADPTRHEQELELAMLRRMDVSDPNDQPSPYVCGNTDRYGAQPPLVRETKPPRNPKRPQQKPLRMQRQW
jgi:hypothetical protein